MVEVWQVQVVAKSPESAGKVSGRIVLKRAGNDPSPWGLRKHLGEFAVIPKDYENE